MRTFPVPENAFVRRSGASGKIESEVILGKCVQ
jgi:hypothetical protein